VDRGRQRRYGAGAHRCRPRSGEHDAVKTNGGPCARAGILALRYIAATRGWIYVDTDVSARRVYDAGSAR
jgi:hypothetical protein